MESLAPYPAPYPQRLTLTSDDSRWGHLELSDDVDLTSAPSTWDASLAFAHLSIRSSGSARRSLACVQRSGARSIVQWFRLAPPPAANNLWVPAGTVALFATAAAAADPARTPLLTLELRKGEARAIELP